MNTIDTFLRKKTVDDILNVLILFFFMLAFWRLTYQSNIYILYSVVFIPFLLKNRTDIYLYICLIAFVLVFLIHFFYHGGNDAFRIYKTFAVLLPAFFYKIKRNEKIVFNIIDVFVYINVILVYIDFILFFTIGTTITPIGISDFMPRLSGLTEDSNFYSYLILVYSFSKFAISRKFPLFVYFSIFLSGSFAAIIASIILLLLYHKIDSDKYDLHKFRKRVSMVTVISFLLYILVVFYSYTIIDYFESFGFIGLLKIKLISMNHRFLVQNESMTYFIEQYNFFLGAGAGETINLNSLGLNLHNSYYQLLLESGLICFILVLSIIFYMGMKIDNLKIYLLYCIVFLLGCMMEVFYFPLLSFIYYYGRTNFKRN